MRAPREARRARRGAPLARQRRNKRRASSSRRRQAEREIAERQGRRARAAAAPPAGTAGRSADWRSAERRSRRHAGGEAEGAAPAAGRPEWPSRWSGRARCRAGSRRRRRVSSPRPCARPAQAEASEARRWRSPAGTAPSRGRTAEQDVAEIGAGTAEPVPRRPAGGGAQRRIGRAVRRQRERAGEAERTSSAPQVRTANRRTASRSASRQSGASSRFGARVATVAMSHPQSSVR